MAEKITKDSDPLLWTLLHNLYVNENKPRDVYRANKLYRALQGYSEEIFFFEVDTLNYLDSRSIKGSRKASYKNISDK